MSTPAKEVAFEGLRGVQGSPIIALQFREMDGPRTVAIGMGPNDAWKIMGVLEEKSLRQKAGEQFDPALSFFLFLGQFMQSVESKIDRLVITGYDGNMWKATLSVDGPQGPREIVCRASDGVALAMAAEAKVYATDEALSHQPGD